MRILPFYARALYSVGMRIALPFLITLAACAPFPELDGTISESARNAPYPRLTPIPPRDDGAVTSADAAMAARIAALNARAERLRETEIGALQ